MPANTGGQITKFHVLVVGLSLMLTLGAWQFSKKQFDTGAELRFEAARDATTGLIADRMERYEDALWAGVAAVESHGGDISYEDWKNFAQNLRVEQRYPGINGIGVIHFLTDETLGGYLVEQRRERPDFDVFPEHDQPMSMPITFVEPEAENRAAVGLDVAHEINRRTGAVASRDSGLAQITGAITLVQDANQTPGFLFYAPFYRDGPQASVEARREMALGAVYAPFVVHRLMDGLLAKELRGVRFSIHDGDTLIYDEHGENDPALDPNPMFSEVLSLDLYGRSWQLDVRTNLAFRQENLSSKPTMILFAGVVIECLIIALLLMMSRANARAVRYADKVTNALKKESTALASSNAVLVAKNEEIERFLYVASHDLKTPIRGIGGLTEMIEEDLEDYLATPAANPDVRENLSLIQDRVSRMSQLTKGILDFSKIKPNDTHSDPLDLREAVKTMRFDFDLDEDELNLSGDLRSINADTLNLRRVLENLVGNAIKYHDGVKTLRIEIHAQSVADRCRLSVSDNGPGINQKYHAKVFEMFQTLRTAGMPESTGMGLSIAKRAIERNGGRIALTSTLGNGCTFTFDWPRVSSARLSEVSKESKVA